MVLPTIHLNGTPKNRLIDGLCEVSEALDAAFAAMKRAGPNGRDYYPQGPDALPAAIDEHNDRMRRLDAIKSEVDVLINAIHDL